MGKTKERGLRMSTYYFKSKTDGRIDGYVTERTLAKAKYKLWLKGASEYYQDFKSYLKDIEIKFVGKTEIE